MPENPLKILSTKETNTAPPQTNSRGARVEMQAKMERLWLTDPKQFDPTRNNIERVRLERTEELFNSLPERIGPAVDLGCGYGDLSRKIRDAGWSVDAVDIAANALKMCEKKGSDRINLIQDALPCTKLEDDAYNLVVCTEVIGYLTPRDYRLLMAELSRLVKRDGRVICSTAIDINSEDALQRFGELAETEFQIIRWRFNHHLLLIRLKQFFEAPSEYFRGSQDGELRHRELNNRAGLSRWWYKVNTTKGVGILWAPLNWFFKPVVYFLRQNKGVMTLLEKVCRFFWDRSGISHATFLGKRRSFIPPTKEDLESVEPKGKRQVWE